MGVFDHGRATYRCWANIILGHGRVPEASKQTSNYFLVSSAECPRVEEDDQIFLDFE